MANENTSNPLIRMETLLETIAENTENRSETLVIEFTFTETPGVATVDVTLAEVQAAHEAGARVIVKGAVNEDSLVYADVTGFIYGGVTGTEGLACWTTSIVEPGESGPGQIYLVQGGDEYALFSAITVS